MFQIPKHPERGTAHATRGDLSSLDGASTWLNSDPLTSAGLVGRTVLVNFWTYSCINWRRTLPHIRGWAERYHDQGLTVIGVHTPEFGFEHDVENVRRAVSDAKIAYPVVLDNDYAIWRDLENHYWPALYFVDVHGRVRYQMFGEENYEQAEGLIQQLLDEAGATGIGSGPLATDATGVEAPADWANLRSPETYLGYDRAESFTSPGGLVPDQSHVYDFPDRLRSNRWALTGDWTIGHQATTSNDADGRITYRFNARDLHLVMGPGSRGGSVRLRVQLDGQPPGSAHGIDVDPDGIGLVTEPRLYQLVRRQNPSGPSTFEITFLDPGVEVYVFTFG